MNASVRSSWADRARPAAAPPPLSASRPQQAQRALRLGATIWFAVAAPGQLLFAVYVLVFYGGTALQGQPQQWNQVLTAGHIAGDRLGNAALAAHLLFAVLVTVGGLLQLVPSIRQRWPALHRWNGRLFLLGAIIGSLSGLLMTWTRPTAGDLSQHLSISLNALLILGGAALAWRSARARRFDVHRRWALRLFLLVNGVWFFRIGLMLWLVLNGGPVGFDPQRFSGPFLTGLAVAQYLVPLAVAEAYFRAQDSRAPTLPWTMAGLLGLLSLLTLGGVAAAAAILWLPRMSLLNS